MQTKNYGDLFTFIQALIVLNTDGSRMQNYSPVYKPKASGGLQYYAVLA